MLIRKYFVSRRCDGPLVTDPLNLWMRWAIVKKKKQLHGNVRRGLSNWAPLVGGALPDSPGLTWIRT